jgi:hypothetical protein
MPRNLARSLAAAVFIVLALSSCLDEECITVIVTNNSGEAVTVFETECWPLDLSVGPGESGNIFVLPGEIVYAEGEVSEKSYSHVFSDEYDTWEIK